MTYDVFLSVVILHLLFLLEFLELGISSVYYVWMWIYFALAIFFGGCSFGPLMFAHHEYLYQKYKKGEKGNRSENLLNNSDNWKDNLLFSGLTFLSVAVAMIFSFFPDDMRVLQFLWK